MFHEAAASPNPPWGSKKNGIASFFFFFHVIAHLLLKKLLIHLIRETISIPKLPKFFCTGVKKVQIPFWDTFFFFFSATLKELWIPFFHEAAASQNPPCWSEKSWNSLLGHSFNIFVLIFQYYYYFAFKGIIHSLDPWGGLYPKVFAGWRIKKKKGLKIEL